MESQRTEADLKKQVDELKARLKKTKAADTGKKIAKKEINSIAGLRGEIDRLNNQITAMNTRLGKAQDQLIDLQTEKSRGGTYGQRRFFYS
jgi:chromosome segregation ATPase